MIWKEKVKWLNDEDAKQLAITYDFSGGQIDNVIRKILMNLLLHNLDITMKELTGYCDNELFVKNKEVKRIGFIPAK